MLGVGPAAVLTVRSVLPLMEAFLPAPDKLARLTPGAAGGAAAAERPADALACPALSAAWHGLEHSLMEILQHSTGVFVCQVVVRRSQGSRLSYNQAQRSDKCTLVEQWSISMTSGMAA